MRKPTFFLSSTIYDFKDLRSAIKHTLEQQGYRVLASEFNDFSKTLVKHSYEECLQSINTCDYFILLIGSRIGGWYDEENKISITQMEYRTAYELQKAGKIKIINFVRSDLWRLRQDRNELSKFLESLPIDGSIRNSIVNYPSKFHEDAQFIASFIDEVGRGAESRGVKKEGGERPIGNWIHTFNGFKDIIDAFDSLMFSQRPSDEQALRRLLRREIIEILRVCLVKFGPGKIMAPRGAIRLFHKDHIITKECRDKALFAVKANRWDTISTLAMNLVRVKINPVILPWALASPAFLRFDTDSNSYVETDISNCLFKLYREIELLNSNNTQERISLIFKHSPITRRVKSDDVMIETDSLLHFLHLMDRWSNVVDLSTCILHHLDGSPFKKPELMPDSPLRDMAKTLSEEIPEDQEIESYVKESFPS